RNRNEPVADFGLAGLLRTRQSCELHLPDHLRLRLITERTDPRGPVDRHRRRSLQQVCTNVVGIETRITWRRVLAQVDHELECCNSLRTVDCGLAIRVKHLTAKSP